MPSMQHYLFVDLDDTLFQTQRKIPSQQLDNVRPTAYLRNGEVISYATAKQQRLWHGLAQGFRVVPVTARDFHAFHRVDLPFREEAVLNHGGVVLQADRSLDMEWHETLSAKLRGHGDDLQALLDTVLQYRAVSGDSGFRPWLVEDFGVQWYLVVKHDGGDEAALLRLRQYLQGSFAPVQTGRFYLHDNGNNLAVLPAPVNKADAVAYLQGRYAERHGCELLTVGMGDSLTDAPFMALCDYAMLPRNTQLHRRVFADAL